MIGPNRSKLGVRAAANDVLVTGGRPLRGSVVLGGSKHSALNLLGALLLARGPVTLEQFPKLSDTENMLDIYRSFGLQTEEKGHDLVAHLDRGTLKFNASDLGKSKQLRSSILLLGSALLRLGSIRFPAPGGDAFGNRPLDCYLDLLKDFGIPCSADAGMVEAKLARPLTGDRTIDVRDNRKLTSVNESALAMILAAGNEGTTTLKNVLQVREVTELGAFLSQLGVRVKGLGTQTVVIDSPGIDHLSPAPVRHRISPDKTELLFWVVAAALTKGTIDVRMNTDEKLSLDRLGPDYRLYPNVLKPLGIQLRQVGPNVFRVDGRESRLHAGDIDIDYRGEFSGRIADALPQLVPLLATTPGQSHLRDERYGISRLSFYKALDQMGAHILAKGDGLDISGVDHLHGARVEGDDIRAAASLLLAALAADGVSDVGGMDKVDRGYEDLIGKLRSLGADIASAPNSSGDAVPSASKASAVPGDWLQASQTAV